MKTLLVLLDIQIHLIKNTLNNLKRESYLKILVIASFLILFWIGAFFLFYRGFSYFCLFPGIGALLVERATALLLAAIFFMLLISTSFTAYTTIFCSNEVDFLLSFPISYNRTFLYKFLVTFILSGWAILFLILPLLLAYGLIQRLGFVFYLLSFLTTLSFIFIATLLGTILTLTLARFFPKPVGLRKILFFLCFIVVVSLYIFRSIEVGSPESVGTAYILNFMLKHTSFLQFPFLPNYWLSTAIKSLATQNLKEFCFYLMLLVSSFLFLCEILGFLADRFYYISLERLRLTGRVRFYTSKWLNQLIDRVFGFLRPSMRVIILKDIKLFCRDPSQWLQFAIFFGLIGVYILNLRTLPDNLSLAGFWKILITFLNLGAISLTMAMLNVRFVFPLLSLEGKRFWIIGLSPIEIRNILKEKFWLSFLGSLIITEILMMLSCIMLGISGPLVWLSLGTIFLMCLAICGLTVGLSAIYPDFTQTNPAAIVSGFGGTLLLVLGLFYLGAIIFLEALFIYWYLSGQFPYPILTKLTIITVINIIIISFIVSFLPMELGIRHLEKMEF